MTSDILTAPKSSPITATVAPNQPSPNSRPASHSTDGVSSARWLSPSTARPCERPQAARCTQGGVRIPADSGQ